MITRPSVDTVMVMPDGTNSKIEVVLPKDKQLSDPPLDGKFFIECRDVDGKQYATKDISLWANTNDVLTRLAEDCGFLREKVSVQKGSGTYENPTMGVEFLFDFWGFD